MQPEKYPAHDKTHFYKYMSAETAFLILRNRNFRYSSPILFNDPFDIQTELLFDFDKKLFPELVFEEIEKIILGKKTVKLNLKDEWGQAISLLKAKVEEYGYSRECAKSTTVPSIKALTDVMEKTRSDYNKWWQDFLPRIRVFSVSEINDNILMWAHYSNKHEGVVLKLRVLPKLGNLLCAAGPVIYREKPPLFFSMKDWIDEIISIREIDHTKLYWEYAYIKSDIWSYEQEWRVWDMLPKREKNLYNYNRLYPEEIEAVYFGCRTSEQNRTEIMNLAREVNPKVLFFQGSKCSDKFALTFSQI
ncbi:MAG: DUF2971 domain-containing protein [Planctomycetes bacterium]|nr:DUF2971 domain-containing protein [Planctomycetota bacterium]